MQGQRENALIEHLKEHENAECKGQDEKCDRISLRSPFITYLLNKKNYLNLAETSLRADQSERASSILLETSRWIIRVAGLRRLPAFYLRPSYQVLCLGSSALFERAGTT